MTKSILSEFNSQHFFCFNDTKNNGIFYKLQVQVIKLYLYFCKPYFFVQHYTFEIFQFCKSSSSSSFILSTI